MNAVGYVRVSTEDQIAGTSLDMQREMIRDWCAAQGHVLLAMTSDEGISGSNGLDTRLGLADALALVESRQAQVLVVYRLDRLARDLLVQETVISRLRASGGQVASVSEPDISSDDPTRVLVRQVIGAIAQYERAVIRGRMMTGRRTVMARGGYGGGIVKFGARVEGGKLVPDEAEQDVVSRAQSLRAEGHSLRAIAAELESSGARPRRGTRWHPAQVARLLD